MTAGADQPWQWPLDRVRSVVHAVRAGRRLAGPWPGDARAAVAISFDADHETIPLRNEELSPGRMAQGEYGSRVGSRRVVDLLERHQVPATFFVPAVSAWLHPDEARGYVTAGHEVALHGWIHERTTTLTEQVEGELLDRSIALLHEVTGTRPVGIRTPSWDLTAATIPLARARGLLYDSSLMADDEPYELLADDLPTGLVEIPVEWIRDDAPYLTMDRFGSARPYTAPSDLLDIWQAELDGALSEGGLFQLTLHPHVIGHRSRVWVLDRLLRSVVGRDDVWLATHADVARHAAARLAETAGSSDPTTEDIA